MGAILAWPASKRARAIGAVAGAALIFAINILRIATLARASTSTWFTTLHIYIWPLVLTVAIAAYFFAWLSLVPLTLHARWQYVAQTFRSWDRENKKKKKNNKNIITAE